MSGACLCIKSISITMNIIILRYLLSDPSGCKHPNTGKPYKLLKGNHKRNPNQRSTNATILHKVPKKQQNHNVLRFNSGAMTDTWVLTRVFGGFLQAFISLIFLPRSSIGLTCSGPGMDLKTLRFGCPFEVFARLHWFALVFWYPFQVLSVAN